MACGSVSVCAQLSDLIKYLRRLIGPAGRPPLPLGGADSSPSVPGERASKRASKSAAVHANWGGGSGGRVEKGEEQEERAWWEQLLTLAARPRGGGALTALWEELNHTCCVKLSHGHSLQSLSLFEFFAKPFF